MTYSDSPPESSAQSSAQSSEQSREPTASEIASGFDARVSSLETECAIMREWIERINAIVVRISDSALRTH